MWCLFIDLFTGIKASRFPFIESSYEYFRPHDRIKHWICTLPRDWYVQPNTCLQCTVTTIHPHLKVRIHSIRTWCKVRPRQVPRLTWKWLCKAILFLSQIYDSESSLPHRCLFSRIQTWKMSQRSKTYLVKPWDQCKCSLILCQKKF